MRDKVLEIIAYEGGIKGDRLHDEAKLEDDLGITGDDLWDVLDHMDKEFGIDWGDTDFSYFFYPECAGFIWSLLNKDKVNSIKRHPITVGHLVKVAEAKKWSMPKSVN